VKVKDILMECIEAPFALAAFVGDK
jgi:hypothetical protein